MLHKLRFKKKFRCFKAGAEIEFRSGVNLLVGDQGSGKSSLLQAIAAVSKAKKYTYPFNLSKDIEIEADPITSGGFDFEQDNHRTQAYIGADAKFQLAAMFSSHGEQNMGVLRSINNSNNTILFLDEPDMALSIRSITEMIVIFKNAVTRGCQIIAAVHHPFVIWAFPEVFNCETRSWVNSAEFVAAQTDTIRQKTFTF